MKILITGASGFVGRQLVPNLQERGLQVAVCGRTPEALAKLFPNAEIVSYDDVERRCAGYDALLHLAVLNNDTDADEALFRAVNVDFTCEVARKAREAGIACFVNFSSFHALEGGSDTPYAVSKRLATEALSKIEDLKIVDLCLPAVYGDDFAGKLSILKKLPNPVRRPVFSFLSALAPTAHVDRIADFVIASLREASGGEIVLLSDPKDDNWVYVTVRKLIDFVFATATLLFFWWLLLLIWALVRLESPGPGIFAQERVGKAGKVFTCYKFRSMRLGTRQLGTHEISASSVTRIGAFIRKTKIDELPQIWNLFRGELSLIGPRPCLPVQEELVAERDRRGVLSVLPGITGLAQVQGIDMSDPKRLARKDAEYVARRGLLLDLKIILATFTGKGQGDRTRLENAHASSGPE